MYGLVRQEFVVFNFLRTSTAKTEKSGRPQGGGGDDPLLEELLSLANQADHGVVSQPLGEMTPDERRRELFGT